MIWLVIWVVLSTLIPEPSTATGNTLARTTLGEHVLDVVLMSSQKQMDRIDAGRVVATMQDVHSFRDRLNKDAVGYARSQQVSLSSASSANNAVTILVRATGPEDAAVWLFSTDVPKEPISQGCDLVALVTGLRAVLTFADFDLAGEDGESLVAMQANASDLRRMTRHAGPPSKVQGVRSDVFTRVAPLF